MIWALAEPVLLKCIVISSYDHHLYIYIHFNLEHPPASEHLKSVVSSVNYLYKKSQKVPITYHLG